MEHITVIELGNNKVKLVPDEGYKLLDKRSDKIYSEAVIKRNLMKYFVAIEE